MLRTISHVLSHTRIGGELVQHSIDVHDWTAAPCSDDSRMRRNALPSVTPKPRSSGSAITVASRSCRRQPLPEGG